MTTKTTANDVGDDNIAPYNDVTTINSELSGVSSLTTPSVFNSPDGREIVNGGRGERGMGRGSHLSHLLWHDDKIDAGSNDKEEDLNKQVR
eukprot:CAMPEP_0172489168 /NCGR_PEP_ID=MMETSP1066-20121228/18999_1 /TAXON_ID=671091 /ORGANISM="Coscinodiscus wailesii, Strain CCMP2513" /LENGTH=90 /DNA_ID=CAMNT_0013256831 /DNA_START=22 /DNA_END=291 /DNA_ORIENTATION=+